MDNNPNDFEDILLDIFVENHTNPSKDWVSLPIEELTKKQLENFKQKRTQASISEEDRRKEAIADGWYINSLLTLAHERYHLEKDEYLEFTANVATAIVEHSDTPDSIKSCEQNSQIANLSELSPWQEEYLIYLATIFQSVLDLKRSMENGYYIPKEIQRKMGISLNYKRIGAWDQGRIKWQAAAQILWLDEEANVEKIKQSLMQSKLFELLDLRMFSSTSNPSNSAEGIEIKYRALEDLIRKVNPGRAKRGRPSKSAVISRHIIFIPTIYNTDLKELNTEALHIAIEAMVQVLKNQKMSLQVTVNHPIIHQYKSLVPLLETIIDTWIMSAFQD